MKTFAVFIISTVVGILRLSGGTFSDMVQENEEKRQTREEKIRQAVLDDREQRKMAEYKKRLEQKQLQDKREREEREAKAAQERRDKLAKQAQEKRERDEREAKREAREEQERKDQLDQETRREALEMQERRTRLAEREQERRDKQAARELERRNAELEFKLRQEQKAAAAEDRELEKKVKRQRRYQEWAVKKIDSAEVLYTACENTRWTSWGNKQIQDKLRIAWTELSDIHPDDLESVHPASAVRLQQLKAKIAARYRASGSEKDSCGYIRLSSF